MKIPASELMPWLRSQPSERYFDLRDHSGNIVANVTPREAQHLCEPGHVEGVATTRGHMKHLRLTVATRVAMGRLRRKMSATGRTISEACQTVTRQEVAGRRVLYMHHLRRAGTYAPEHRGEFYRTVGL